ncbi:MAG: TIM44-like domain-containing protein [Myxococcales bacterium]|nr:TIM44-like domain-containing protein [Myxococcales bacterium]
MTRPARTSVDTAPPPAAPRGRATRTLAIAVAVLVLVALAGVAAARPGGGDSFSGGGGHGGSGGGGGGGSGAVFELVYWLLRLIIHVPQVGIPLLVIVVGFLIYSAYKQHQNKDWDSGPPVQLKRAVRADEVKRYDPEFSQVLFEDFAFRLFSTAQRARGSPQTLDTVAPYVSAPARQHLWQRSPNTPVRSAVVGAMRVYRVEIPPAPVDPQGRPNRIRIGVEFEANVTTDQHTYYTVETWLFGRDATRLSKPPGSSKNFPCPNCGAPWQSAQTGTQKCASCGEVVDNGRFDWIVEQISLASSDERGPTLTKEVPERGTDLATYRSSDVDQRWMELERDDPAITEQNLVARLNLIYSELNKAWASNDLRPVRGMVSDGLFDYLQYWIDAYKKQGMRNALEDMRISHTIVAKVTRDKWYDAVTIRVWAKGKDYVVKGDKVVRGSKHRDRAYSEYWTLIRSSRAKRGAPLATPNCPSCGAPLKITMSGECEYCQAHITAGEFDWVLSKIEQDDTYRG